MADNISKLYEALKDSYELGSEENFRNYLSDGNKREALRKELESEWEVGDSASFTRYLGFDEPEPQNDEAFTMSESELTANETQKPEKPAAPKAQPQKQAAAPITTQNIPSVQQMMENRPQLQPFWKKVEKAEEDPINSPKKVGALDDHRVEADIKMRVMQNKVDAVGKKIAAQEKYRKGLQPFASEAQRIEIGNTESAFDRRNPRVVEAETQYNPITQKLEKTYLNEAGEYTNRTLAEREQAQKDKDIERALKPLETQLAEAYEERDRLNELARQRREELEEEYRNKPWLERVVSTANSNRLGVPSPSYRWLEDDKQYQQYMTALRKNNELINTLEDAHNNTTNSFWHSIGNEITNGYTFSLGGAATIGDIAAIADASKYADTITKKRKNDEPLTKEEEAAEAILKNAAWDNQVQLEYGDQYGAWARAGKMGATSLDFMYDFLLMGGIPKATATGILKGVEKYGEKALGKYVTNGLGKYMLKATGATLGTMVAGAEIANTIELGKVGAEAAHNYMGDVFKDENGNYVFGHMESKGKGGSKFVKGGEGIIGSIIDAERTYITENASEVAGSFMPGGKLMIKGMEKMRLSKIANWLTAIGDRKWYKKLTNGLESIGFNGLVEEPLEEYVGMFDDFLLGGDEWKNLADKRTHIDIWLGCTTMGAFLSAPRFVGTGYEVAQYYRYKHKTDDADKVAAYRLTNEVWEPIREKIDGATNSQMTDVLLDIIRNNKFTKEEWQAVTSYVKNLQQMRGYDLGRIAANERTENTKPQTEEEQAAKDVNNSYAEGYNANEPEDKIDAKNRYEILRQRAVEAFSEEDINLVDNYPISRLFAVANANGYTEEEKQLLLDYVNAKATYDGMMQKVADDVDSQTTISNTMIDSRTHKDGMIHPVTLKGDKKVYVVDGRLAQLADGSVDVKNSDTALIIKDENGKIGYAAPKDIVSVEDSIEPEEEKQAAAQTISETITKQATDEIEGTLAFNAGDQYDVIDNEGNAHKVTIGISVGLPEGQVLASIDGADAQPMSKEEIQAMANNANLARLAEHEQEKEAKRATEAAADAADAVAQYTEGAPANYTEGTEIVVRDEDGNEKPAMVMGRVSIQDGQFVPDENGNMVEYLIDGEGVHDYIGDLNNKVVRYREPKEEEEAAPETQQMGQEAQAVQGGEAVGEASPEQAGANEPAATIPAPAGEAAGTTADENAMPMVEVNGKMKPDFDAATPQRAYQYIYNERGLSKEEADAFVDTNIKAVDKEIDKQENKAPKFGTGENEYTDLDEYTERKAAWLAEMDALNARKAKWEAIKAEQDALNAAAQQAAFAEQTAEPLDRQAMLDEQKEDNPASAGRDGEQNKEQDFIESLTKLLNDYDSGDNGYLTDLDVIEQARGLMDELQDGSEIGKMLDEAFEAYDDTHNAYLYENGQRDDDGSEAMIEALRGVVAEAKTVKESGTTSIGNKGKTSTPEEIMAEEGKVNTSPTEGQKEAGNYKKGHIKVDGFDVTIENPKGSVRSGVDEDGNEWQQEMHNSYGYIRGTEGVDGDHIDVFLSDDPESGYIYVIDQVDKMGIFDEHKVMYGFDSVVEAQDAYLSNYEEGWQGLGAITRVSRENFKKWIESSHRKTKPFSEYALNFGEDEGTYIGIGNGIASPAEKVSSEGYDKPIASKKEAEDFLKSIGYDRSVSRVSTGTNGKKYIRYHASGVVTPNIVFGETTPREVYQQFHLYGNVMGVNIPADLEEEFSRQEAEQKAASDAIYANEREEIKSVLKDAGIPFHDVIDSERGSRIVFTDKKNDNGNYTDYVDVADVEQAKDDIEFIRERAKSFSQEEEKTKEKKPMPTESKKDKIDDVGEVIEGARKQLLSKMSMTFAEATKQALADLPFAKAFKKPDLKKAIENGVLREKDAIFYEVFFNTGINQQKPKVTMRDERMKKWKPDYKTDLEKWIDRTYETLQVLKGFIEADEATRDEIIDKVMSDRFPNREAQLAEIERVKALNPNKTTWGDNTTPNPMWITYEVLQQLGHEVGDKVDLPFSKVEATTDGTGYILRDAKGNRLYLKQLNSVDDAIAQIVWLAKLKRGNSDIQHPVEAFSVVPTESVMGETGRYEVMWMSGLNIKIQTFDTKEEADAAAAKKKGGARVTPERKVVGRKGYKVAFNNPLTGERFHVNEEKFDTKEEGTQYLDSDFDALNEAVNKKLEEQRNEKKDIKKKELTADDVIGVGMVFTGGKWQYGVWIDKKYANNYGMNYPLKEGFATMKEAKEYKDKVKDEVFKAWQEAKESRKAFAYFDTGEDSRRGEDWRGGNDVTAEDFMNEFGFRGVQFGNWTNQRDRQMAINQAYDAFMDLAKLIGVSPKALSLNGELGIAFGARGVGNALAHYEPSEIVINLTKKRGAGSLAHEWWHALDNYFARAVGEPGGMVTDDTHLKMRDELRKAFNDMLDKVRQSDYYRRSRAEGDYWGRMHEVTARLLAEWVDQELKKRGELNTFLSRGANVEPFIKVNYDNYVKTQQALGEEPMPYEEYMETKDALRGMPYPSAKEVEGFADAMRNIFDTIQERVDEETGKTILYQKAKQALPASKEEKKIVKWLAELLNAMGIKTSTDWKKGQRVLDAYKELADFMSRGNKKTTPETASVTGSQQHHPTVVSSVDGAKILKNLEKVARDFEKLSNQSKFFIGTVGKALNAKRYGSKSEYADFVTDDGTVVSIRLADHNAKAKNSERAGRYNVISIVIAPKKGNNKGILNDGKSHIAEYYYEAIDLRKAEGKPLADIVRAIADALHTGKFIDPTGLAKPGEVNAETLREMRVYHGSGADFDAFDHRHMGEGEGYQAYGWGSYVTEVEGIGRTYAKSSANKPIGSRRVLYKGEDFRSQNTDEWPQEKESVFIDIAGAGMQRQGKSAQKAIDDLRIMTEQSISNQKKALNHAESRRPLLENILNYLKGVTEEQYIENKKGDFKDVLSEEEARILNYVYQDTNNIQEAIEEVEFMLDNNKKLKGMASSRIPKLEVRLKYLNEFDENDFTREEPQAVLYTVEIPDGLPYLEYNKKMGEQQDILDSVDNELTAQGWKRQEIDSRIVFTNPYQKVVLTPNQSGADLYEELKFAFGGAQAASEFLRNIGVAGIKYPAEYRSGGRSDGASNYVIFDENDLQITDKIKFFRTNDGEVYGFTLGGEIYLDPRIATSETPIHEYAHLWSEALEQANPQAWQQLKNELMNDTELLNYVKGLYPDIKDENELMHEVFSHFAGRQGKARLDKLRQEEMAKADGILNKARIAAMFHRLAELLDKYWNMARDLFAGKVEGLENKTKEDFADMMMSSLLNKFDPRTVTGNAAKARDKKYADAVEAGDTKKAEQMVKEAAKDAMPEMKILDENGEPLVVYHGTTEDFNVFDRAKGRANMDIQGMFFSPWELDAKGYGNNVRAFFLDIKNPADFKTAFAALQKFRGQDNAGVMARELLTSQGYDGVNNDNEEFIAFYPEQIKSADAATYDDNGNLIPLSKRFDKSNSDIRYSKSSDIEKQYPNWMDNQVTTDKDSKRGQNTQVATTVGTYKKVGKWVEDNLGKDVKILDASSGLGLGTLELRNAGFDVDDIEPYAGKGRQEQPTYGGEDAYQRAIDDGKKYDYIISNAVLNVIPDDWRNGVLHNMAQLLNDGGKMFINTRKAGEEKGIKNKIELESPQEVLVGTPDRITSYQRFFTPTELKEYVESELGDGYSVEIANTKNSGTNGLAAVVVTKEPKNGVMPIEPVITNDVSRGNVVEFNVTTYKNEKQELKDAFRDAGWDEEQIDEIFSISDKVAEDIEELRKSSGLLDEFSKREGNPKREILKSNPEYAGSFDYSYDCVKKEALNYVIEQMVSRGKSSHLGQTQIEAIKKVLEKHGYLAPCVMCYVEGKRKLLKQSKETEQRWNAVADAAGLPDAPIGEPTELTDEQLRALSELAVGKGMDKIEGGDERIPVAVVKQIANLMLNNDILRGRFNHEWLMTPSGYDNFIDKFGGTGIMGFVTLGQYKGKALLGATPFSFQSITPERFDELFNPVKWAREGGLRMFSYEDARPIMFFDYYQQMLLLQAAHAPLHLYTKREMMPDLLGETGAMINQSLVADIWKGSEAHRKHLGLDEKAYNEWLRSHAGLIPKGELDGSGDYDTLVPNYSKDSFPIEAAMRNAKDERFGGRVGNAVLAPSDEFILWALNNPDIHQILAYHAAGASPVQRALVGYDFATPYDRDYLTGDAKTNISDFRNGIVVENGKLKWNILLRKFQREGLGAREAAQYYVNYCKEHGITPAFEKFSTHPEYYKLLVDFRAYDEAGNSVMQKAVKATLPEGWQEKLRGYLGEQEQATAEVSDIANNKELQRELQQVTKYVSIEPAEREAVVKILGEIYGKDNVFILGKDEFDKALDAESEDGKAAALRDAGGVVYGFTKGGKIWIAEDLFNAHTPMHEHSHIVMRVIELTDPKLHQRGIDLWKGTDMWNNVKEHLESLGENTSDARILSELVSQFTGNENEKLISEMTGITDKNWLQRALDWLKDLWNGVKSAFSSKWSEEDLAALDKENYAMIPFRVFYDPVERKRFINRLKRIKNFEMAANMEADKAEYHFAGEQGAAEADRAEGVVTRMENLGVAKQMEADGKPALNIKMATGWERGKDGKWRYETDDDHIKAENGITDVYDRAIREEKELEKKADALLARVNRLDASIPKRLTDRYSEEEKAKYTKMREERDKLINEWSKANRAFRAKEDKNRIEGIKTTVGEILGDNYVLFKYYPDIENMPVILTERLDANGEYDEGSIKLRLRLDGMGSTLLHEIQHAIQEKEGFARGGNMSSVLSDDEVNEVFVTEVRNSLNDVEDKLNLIKDAKGSDEAVARYAEERGISEEDARAYLDSEEARLMLKEREYNHLFEMLGNDNLPRSTAFEYYRRIAGEVEARNVQARAGMTPEERRRSLAEETEDILRGEQIVTYGDAGESASIVEDKNEVARLEAEPKEVGYRNVVLNEDGTLGSPMANRLGKKGTGRKATSGFEFNKWERSDEHPELATDKGKIDLIKPNGNTVGSVDYNPYIHIRPTLVNKQFKQAWERPNLVYVRTEYPASELDKGYKAEKAKLSVGKHPWNGGELILSRWDKPIEIVPWEEVADDWVKEFDGKGIHFDIIPPKLLPILKERGMEILPPHKGMGKECNAAYEAWKNGNDVRFAVGDGTREAYNKAVNMGVQSATGMRWYDPKSWRMTGYNFREAFQDSMLALRKLQEVVEKKYGIKLGTDEDAYKAENALSSTNDKQKEYFKNEILEPMNKVVDRMISKEGVTKGELNNYLICKHGLERNVVMAGRDAKREYDTLKANGVNADLNALIKKYRKKDYSGLTGLTGNAFTSSAEAVANNIVRNFEKEHGESCRELWDAINTATKWTLKKGYDSGMMSTETYDKVRNMFDYYIPLRGWDEDTAEEVYDYLMNERGVFNGTIVAAKGHTHKSDDPLAIIANMGESAILQGNRNMMKQKFLSMATKYPTDVCKVRDIWLVKQADGKWKADFPVIPAHATSDEVAQIIAQHDADMEAMRKNGDAKRLNNKLDIDWHIDKKDIPEHAVVVYVGGNQHVIYINGNPRAAQAVNGLTGEKRDKAFLDTSIKSLNRYYSSMLTQYKPTFAVTNYARDLQHSILLTYINNGRKDTGELMKNLPAAIKYCIKSRVGKGGNSKMDNYFKEFMMNGGVTGYAHLDDVEKWKMLNSMRWERLSKLQKAAISPSKVFQAGMEAIGWFSETLEQITRFNTYITEREKGKDIGDSIKAAKNITVNFSKKGSEVTPGVWGVLANTLRMERMFFNPMVQGISQIYDAASANPQSRKRLIGVASVFPIFGALIPFVNEALVEAFGGDDDDKDKYDYFLQNEYTRRTNLMLFVGNGYIKWPLPQVFRELYGMGEAISSLWLGKSDIKDTAYAIEEQLRNVFSIEGQSAYKGWSPSRALLPDALTPVLDVEKNENFMGSTIWNESMYKPYLPEYQKAKRGTWSPLVSASKKVNELTGGTENVASESLLQKWSNPAGIQHLIENYGGGVVELIGDVATAVNAVKEGEIPDSKNWPVAKRFYTIPTEESSNWARYRRYKEYLEDYERAKAEHSDLNKGGMSLVEHAKKVVDFENKFPDAANIYYAWKGLDIDKRLNKAEWNSKEYWDIIKEAVNAADKATKDGGKSIINKEARENIDNITEEELIDVVKKGDKGMSKVAEDLIEGRIKEADDSTLANIFDETYGTGIQRKAANEIAKRLGGKDPYTYKSGKYVLYRKYRTYLDHAEDVALDVDWQKAKKAKDADLADEIKFYRDDIAEWMEGLTGILEEDEVTMERIREARRKAFEEIEKFKKERANK